MLNTTILFQLLIKWIKPDVLCDVGSMDGSHSLAFRAIVPNARIIAFEANPDNARLIREAGRLAAAQVELEELAIGPSNGESTFHIERLGEDRSQQWLRGTSSTKRRVEGSLGTREVTVTTRRLDSLPGPQQAHRLALWVDVEGAAYEVLTGIEGLKDSVRVIHVEVETREVWAGQKLADEVDALMRVYGFVPLARGRHALQHDRVYVQQRDLDAYPLGFKMRVFGALALTYLRKWGGRALGEAVMALLVRGSIRFARR